MARWRDPGALTNSAFTPCGKASPGCQVGASRRSIAAGSAQKLTACGLPTSTGTAANSRPSAVSTRTSSVDTRAGPMATRIRPSGSTSVVRSPARVPTGTDGPTASPSSIR